MSTRTVVRPSETVTVADLAVGDRIVVTPPFGAARFGLLIENLYPFEGGSAVVSGRRCSVKDPMVSYMQHKIERVASRHVIERIIPS
jgi:hypothetical protein